MPVWAAIAVAVKLNDGGPVFYSQPRVGKDCRNFTSWKFRSMTANSDRESGVLPTSWRDPRITRVGRLLRATAMDELPQLWNVFRGEMSFVGPRPEWTELAKHFRREIPSFDLRHSVRPGLTGLAQIYGHSEISRRNKLRYDLLYIRRRSAWLDLRLILVSFLVTFAAGWEMRSSKLPSLTRRRRPRRAKPEIQPAGIRIVTVSSPGNPAS
jgi:lipopolysaccharide/colanic/teichoic acid biosynthesis glycosyltransferase